MVTFKFEHLASKEKNQQPIYQPLALTQCTTITNYVNLTVKITVKTLYKSSIYAVILKRRNPLNKHQSPSVPLTHL